MNIALFEKIKEQITREPIRFDMGTYVDAPPEHPCGCTACIGGWAIVLKLEKDPEYLMKFCDDAQKHKLDVNLQQMASDALGIPVGDTNTLFYADVWPEPFRRDYMIATDCGTIEDQARVACARIDHYIKNKE